MHRAAVRKSIAALLAAAFSAFAAEAPSQFPYCENVVKPVAFDAQGSWILTGIAAYSKVLSLDRLPRRRLIGSSITVTGDQVRLFNKKARPWKAPFPTPVLGQQTYDTHSKEFWLDFQTDPKDLNLPRYVSAVNVELGTVLSAGAGRVYFDYSGVWFSLARAAGSSGQTSQESPRTVAGSSAEPEDAASSFGSLAERVCALCAH